MGCVLGREAPNAPAPAPLASASAAAAASIPDGERRKEREGEKERSGSSLSGRKSQVRLTKIDSVLDAPNLSHVDGKEKEKDGDGAERVNHRSGSLQQQQRADRRRSRANPRLSNPPKHVHGEQVAAGWPSWLSQVAGEAIKGWTPRRADTFEKLDKATPYKLFHAY